MSLDFPLCPRCDGYVIEGTLKRTGMTLSSRCRCDDEPWERELEAELRERIGPLTECHPDPFGKAIIAHDIGDAMDLLVSRASKTQGGRVAQKAPASNK